MEAAPQSGKNTALRSWRHGFESQLGHIIHSVSSHRPQRYREPVSPRSHTHILDASRLPGGLFCTSAPLCRGKSEALGGHWIVTHRDEDEGLSCPLALGSPDTLVAPTEPWGPSHTSVYSQEQPQEVGVLIPIGQMRKPRLREGKKVT